MSVDTDALRWFQQVADGVTVTEVADLFETSQPGVSRALARLDQQVGTALLHKNGRLLRPTHAGVLFKRHIDACLHALDDGLAAVAELVDPRTGTVTVAFQLSLGTWLVPQMISTFRRDHPGVTFGLQPSHDALGSSLVAGGRIDLEFTARQPRNPAVHWAHLFSQPLRLAVPVNHRLADRATVSLSEAAEEGFVMLGPSWELRSLSDALCSAAGFTPRVTFEGDDLPVVLGFVAAGLGLAIVPATSGSSHADSADVAASGVRLLPLTDPGAAREVGLAWSLERRLLPSAELFRDHVLAAMKRSSPAF